MTTTAFTASRGQSINQLFIDKHLDGNHCEEQTTSR